MNRIKSSRKWKKHSYNKPRKNYRNYYSKQEKKQKKLIVKIIWIIFIFLLIQSIFHIKLFKIKDISLENNKDININEIQDTIDNFLDTNRLLLFKNSNYFLIEKNKLEDILLEEYNLDKIEIKKSFPNNLNIIITEKISNFILQKDDALYLLTSEGTLNREISGLIDNYPILIDLNEGEVKKEYNIELDYVNNIFLLWNDIIGDKIVIKKIYIEDGKDLKIGTNFEYNIILDKEKDIKDQLNNLNEVILGNITGTDIDYINLKFGKKVFFQ